MIEPRLNKALATTIRPNNHGTPQQALIHPLSTFQKQRIPNVEWDSAQITEIQTEAWTADSGAHLPAVWRATISDIRKSTVYSERLEALFSGTSLRIK
jgi:hypothetical protein